MAQDLDKFLVEQILADGQTVTYRQLSRELNIHCNAAKGLLSTWRAKQKAAQCSATYLITGVPQAVTPPSDDDGDVEMASGLPANGRGHDEDNDQERVPQYMVAICSEGNLEESKAQFATISSVELYSLGPSMVTVGNSTDTTSALLAESFQDLQTLTTGSLHVVDSHDEKALQKYYHCGVIRNPRAKRRTDAAAPLVDMGQDGQRRSSQPSSIRSDASRDPKPEAATGSEAGFKKAVAKPSVVKRQDSNILKSFAKAQPRTQKRERVESAASSPATQAASSQAPTDTLMKETSESEDNETGNFSGEEQNAPLAGANHRAEREQKLRDMMDDEEDTAESPAEVSQATSSKPEEPAQEEQETVTSNGRRRGKRKVMKKKTMQDAEGYLITKEEAVWESFSEEDTKPPPKPRPAVPKSKSTVPANSKGKGNIMSFFGKK